MLKLEGKEGSSKVGNSFFETEDMLLWVGLEWNDEFILQLLNWDSFGILVGNLATSVGDTSIAIEFLDANDLDLD